jgi:hypothetical protein
MSFEDVQTMLGPQDETSWTFTLFYSSALTVRFGRAGRIVGLVSDVPQEISATPDRNDPDVLAAISEFRSQPYSRREPAGKIVGFLKPGTTLEDARSLLGVPNSTVWSYSLLRAGAATLLVGFGEDSRVAERLIKP